MSTARPDRLKPGRAWPLGASVEPGGVNFAVPSAHAEGIDLCLFDPSGRQETARHALPARSADVWHGFLPGAGAGLVYGLRARGRWAPHEGDRFNPHKLLLDPWAREIVGSFEWGPQHFGFDLGDPGRIDTRDNADTALKARVAQDRFDWQGDRPLHTPLADTVLYELHVRGFTMQHPSVPAAQRGTYAGLASDAAIAHLRRLDVTAVSLLPVQQHLDEQRLVRMGLSNYWGYNTIGFFCVEPRYAANPSAARDEFRHMVRRLHGAGIEVLLDVVYNHTAETDQYGPTLSWRGLDNRGWYRLPPGRPADYENDTGCGNTLDLRQPRVLQMVLDSLRYWVQEMHVDGFRFDLAPVLGRTDHGFDRHAPFFNALAQDPVLAGVKLIAEPWDIGPGGYRLGDFPGGWLEWNDRFRDTLRAFWLSHPSTRGELAQRLCGSSDLFRARGRTPGESVNFVAAHDGFTLRDLVSHERRHNLANGEDNRDGHGHNLSTNCGHEGPSDDPAVRERRARLQRALLATLLLSQGTPMLAAGDELGHSQGGNNNPYCQDNPTSWIDWSSADEALIAFTTQLLALRRRLRPLDDRWYDGAAAGSALPELSWLQAQGHPLSAADWQDGQQRALGVLIGAPGRSTQPLLLLLNAQSHDLHFMLPPGAWTVLLDSVDPARAGSSAAPSGWLLKAHGVTLMQQGAA
ncbi:MAG TPA: glycogen debranching protein GlgX [Rubrivivax sp.]